MIHHFPMNFGYDITSKNIEIHWENDSGLTWVIDFCPKKWPIIDVRCYNFPDPNKLKMEVKSFFLAHSLIAYSLEKIKIATTNA